MVSNDSNYFIRETKIRRFLGVVMIGLIVEILILVAVVFEAYISWKSYQLLKKERE